MVTFVSQPSKFSYSLVWDINKPPHVPMFQAGDVLGSENVICLGIVAHWSVRVWPGGKAIIILCPGVQGSYICRFCPGERTVVPIQGYSYKYYLSRV